jgi:glycosyltransferase involved in cell wall biosynthesis
MPTYDRHIDLRAFSERIEVKLKFSIIIPAYNSEITLPALLNSLKKQTYEKDFEIIVVDDCSTDGTCGACHAWEIQPWRLKKNRGPAHCRNLGARRAKGDVLIFTDSDCIVAYDWLEQIERCFAQGDAEVIMGKLVLLPSNFLGDSISALGFPAGGALGFEKVWKVSEDGFTNSLSSCNFAIKRELFEDVGGFDECFPYAGGEDSFLAYSLVQSGYRIKYCPQVLAYHVASDSLKSFLRWQFHRGLSSFIFSKKVTGKRNFASLRLWSTLNIIKHYHSDSKFPLIVFLLLMSFLVQMSGFFCAKYREIIPCEC